MAGTDETRIQMKERTLSASRKTLKDGELDTQDLGKGTSGGKSSPEPGGEQGNIHSQLYVVSVFGHRPEI